MSIEKSYNSWANIYDDNKNKTRDLDKKATIETLSEYNFDNVIEIGCGTGKNTEFLLTKAEKIIAIDFSEKMIKKATTKINSKKVNFIKADITNSWDIKDEFAELTTCSLTLEHIKNIDFIFNEAFKKLKNDGLFFICELHPFKQYMGSKAKYETGNGIEELEVFIHNISEYMKCAKQSGFKLKKLSEWFDNDNKAEIPRLISFLFEK